MVKDISFSPGNSGIGTAPHVDKTCSGGASPALLDLVRALARQAAREAFAPSRAAERGATP